MISPLTRRTLHVSGEKKYSKCSCAREIEGEDSGSVLANPQPDGATGVRIMSKLCLQGEQQGPTADKS